MENDEIYKSIVEEIIVTKKKFFGEAAVVCAKRVMGIELTPEGKVMAIKFDPKAVIIALAEEYRKLSGDIAVTVIKTALIFYRMKYPGIDLPDL